MSSGDAGLLVSALREGGALTILGALACANRLAARCTRRIPNDVRKAIEQAAASVGVSVRSLPVPAVLFCFASMEGNLVRLFSNLLERNESLQEGSSWVRVLHCLPLCPPALRRLWETQGPAALRGPA